MKIISKLKSTAVTDADWHPQHGIRATVHNEPRPGVIRTLSIGEDGVVMRRAGFQAAITADAIITLLEQVEPGLKCPPPPKLKGDDLTEAELKKLGA